MKKQDKLNLLRELKLTEDQFYNKYSDPEIFMSQHPDLYFKYCMGGRMKKFQTGGLQPMPTIGPGQITNNYVQDNTVNGTPQINPATLPNKQNNNSNNKYINAGLDFVGGIGNTINNYKNAQTQDDKNNAITYGTIDTAVNVVGDFGPAVKYVKMGADTTRQVIDLTNPDTTYIDKDGKQHSYKKDDIGTSAAGFKAAADPVGNVTRAIGDFTGSTENYGQNNTAMFFADMFAPFLSQAYRNKQEQKLALQHEKEDINNTDSTAHFKYGGIHIKPSHKGRFTAYKERTGKTTQEALHSSDPHVRKMAQFAVNAKKWKHQTGGELPPEMMQALLQQQGNPEEQVSPQDLQQMQAPPEPYKPGLKDIYPSMKVSSPFKPISYKGRTHQYGGIQVTDNSELEDGEYSVLLKNPQTGEPVRYIFSAATGFANKAKKILEKYGPQYI